MTKLDLIGTCSICRRRHANIGYAPHERAPVKWECEECLELPIAIIKKAYHMPKRRLDDFEEQALSDGGDAGGAYLDEIGKSDLADLDEFEWKTFLSRVLVGYSDSMRDMVSRETPY